jgi:hypothetical protein
MCQTVTISPLCVVLPLWCPVQDHCGIGWCGPSVRLPVIGRGNGRHCCRAKVVRCIGVFVASHCHDDIGVIVTGWRCCVVCAQADQEHGVTCTAHVMLVHSCEVVLCG